MTALEPTPTAPDPARSPAPAPTIARATTGRTATGSSLSAPTARRSFPPAPEPTRPGAIAWVGILVAVLVAGLGLVLLHDGLVAAGVLSGPAWWQGEPWWPDVAGSLDGTVPGTTTTIVGVVVAVVGVLLVAVALGRRRRPRVPLATPEPAMSLGHADVARLASHAAEQVGGVMAARSSAGRRSVHVTIDVPGRESVEEAVRAAVTARLAVLRRPPKVQVTAHVVARVRSVGLS